MIVLGCAERAHDGVGFVLETEVSRPWEQQEALRGDGREEAGSHWHIDWKGRVYVPRKIVVLEQREIWGSEWERLGSKLANKLVAFFLDPMVEAWEFRRKTHPPHILCIHLWTESHKIFHKNRVVHTSMPSLPLVLPVDYQVSQDFV